MLYGGEGVQAQDVAGELDEGPVIEEGLEDIEAQNTGDEHIEEDMEADLKNPEEVEEEKKKSVQPRVVNMSQRITLDLRNMDVNDALTYISLRSGANIVTSKSVTGRVTLQLKDVSIQDIFDITLLTNNLAYEKRGDIYY
ncbi:MAG: hypothetical protein KAR31_08955, partial [Candidatus Omnitrophica bacterium]|nr:hypothetical protein [Candidatus Omnitrophota bacterium]